MRKLFLSLTAAAVTLIAVATVPTMANAAAGTPSAMRPAIADASMIDNVRWVWRCHHHWRSSGSHCGWVQLGYHYHHYPRFHWHHGHHWHHRHHHGHHQHHHHHRHHHRHHR